MKRGHRNCRAKGEVAQGLAKERHGLQHKYVRSDFRVLVKQLINERSESAGVFFIKVTGEFATCYVSQNTERSRGSERETSSHHKIHGDTNCKHV